MGENVGYDLLKFFNARNLLKFCFSWGRKGYLYLARNRKNHCGVATDAVYPLIEPTENN